MNCAFKTAFKIVLGPVLCIGLLSSLSMAETGATVPREQVELKADPKKVPLELEGVGIKEHLGEKLDLQSLQFHDTATGQTKRLGEYFQNGKPTLVNLVYFECPMLCTMVLNGLTEGLRGLQWSVGKEFNLVTISINPKDSDEVARIKRQNYLKSYLEKGESSAAHDEMLASSGWHFLTGSEDQIQTIAKQLGFGFKYDEIQKQYAHPAVTFVMTPEGVISRYLYGITYKPQDLKLALLEASQGKIGNVFDRLLMFCYHYEPSSRGYALQAVRVMQAGGAGTVALLGGFLTVFWTRQRKGKAK